MSKIPQLVLNKKAKDGIDYNNVEIAKEIGLSRAMVSLFMRDKVNISGMAFGTAIAWAEWLECDLLDLVEIVADEA